MTQGRIGSLLRCVQNDMGEVTYFIKRFGRNMLISGIKVIRISVTIMQR